LFKPVISIALLPIAAVPITRKQAGSVANVASLPIFEGFRPHSAHADSAAPRLER
jgi:hypothetical protein